MKMVLRPAPDLPDDFLPDRMYGVVVDPSYVTERSVLVVPPGLARATDRYEVHGGESVRVWEVRDERAEPR